MEDSKVIIKAYLKGNSTPDAEELFGLLEYKFEFVRKLNEQMRDAYDEQLGKLQEEIQDLKIKLKENDK